MGRKFARENLERVAGIDEAKWRPEGEEHLAVEMRRQKYLRIASRVVESLVVAGEAIGGEQGGFEAKRCGIAAMGGFGHGAGVAGEAAASRRSDADRVGKALGIERQEMRSRHRRPDRPYHARRMEFEVA